MRIQQVTNATETLIAQGVKKLKYVTPTCRVGNAEELGLKLKPLNSDILQKTPGTKYLYGSLNELCSSHYINGEEMTKLFERFPNLDPHLGFFPSNLLKNIKSSKIISTQKELSQLLDKYAIEIGSVSVNKEDAIQLGKLLQKELSEMLNSSASVELIGNGTWSRCYKLSINDKSYALKIFQDDISNYDNPRLGPSSEPAIANLLNNISDKCAKFYYGKIGVENNRGAYTISEFLHGDIPNEFKTNHNIADLRKYFWNTDLSNNPNIKITPMDCLHSNLPIGGKFFDYGMFKVEVINDIGKDFIFYI